MVFKVLVVDDSSFYRRRVREILDDDRELEVVGEAKNAVGISIDTPLQSRLNGHTIFLGIYINDFGMQGILFGIHVGDVFLDAALVEVSLLVGIPFLIPG